METKRDKQINVRVNDQHLKTLSYLIETGKAKTQSGALIYLINTYEVLKK